VIFDKPQEIAPRYPESGLTDKASHSNAPFFCCFLAADYVKLDEPSNFYTLVEPVRWRDEVALGYRLHAHADDAMQAYGVVLNPDKSAQLTLAEQGRVVVLAEK
jgi:hypothetical protein